MAKYFLNRGSMISHFLFVISTHLLYVRLLSRTRVWYTERLDRGWLHVGQIGRNKSKLLWKVGLLNFVLWISCNIVCLHGHNDKTKE